MYRFCSVLVQIDSQSPLPPALTAATNVAEQSGASLTIVDMMPPLSWPASILVSGYDRVLSELRRAKEQNLERIAAELRQRVGRVTWKLLQSPSSAAIIQEVNANQHDMVVRTTKGIRSRSNGNLGTTAIRLLRTCPCPILLVPSDSDGSANEVLVALDADEGNEKLRQLNRRICRIGLSFSPTPKFFHAWSIYGENLIKDYMSASEFDELVKGTEAAARTEILSLLQEFQSADSPASIELVRGPATEQILKAVSTHNVDLLVLGTVGRSGISGMIIGNTAERVLSKVTCSLLVVPPESRAVTVVV